MVLYIAISEPALSHNDGDPRAQSMVSLTLLDPNKSGSRSPQSESGPSFTISLPRNSAKIPDRVQSDVSSPTPVLLPELFLRMSLVLAPNASLNPISWVRCVTE